MKSKAKVLCAPLVVLAASVSCGCKAQQPDETGRADVLPSVMDIASPPTTEQGNNQTVGDAPLDCFGDWRITFGPLEGGALDHIPEDSWCRSTPQVLSIKFHRDSQGRPTVVGDPLKPSDVLIGYGTCEFQFEGPTPGVPENYTWVVEVPNDAASPGRAKCTSWGPKQEGRRGGIGLPRTAHATRTGAK